MNLIKYIKQTLRTVKFENKISKVIKNVLAVESNNIITHNSGKLVRQKASWGEIKHNFVEGDITIVTKDGEENYTAPYMGFSKAGVRRVIRGNEYSIFQNVLQNPSDNKDLDFVENYNYALTKKEYKEYIKNK